MGRPDQDVRIQIAGADNPEHIAVGDPERIYTRLHSGYEVVCEAKPSFYPSGSVGHSEYVLRVTPGTPFALRYGEAVER